MSTVAFIGLGNMGIGMAGNLVKAGHDVRGFDLSEAAQKSAKSIGCQVVDSVSDAAKGADAVVMMLSLIHI